MLRVGFAELISTHKRIAADLHDNPLDSLGVLTLVENAQLKQQQQKQKQQQQQQQASLGIVLDFKALLVQRFSKFIEEQARKRLLRERINSVCMCVCVCCVFDTTREFPLPFTSQRETKEYATLDYHSDKCVPLKNFPSNFV